MRLLPVLVLVASCSVAQERPHNPQPKPDQETTAKAASDATTTPAASRKETKDTGTPTKSAERPDYEGLLAEYTHQLANYTGQLATYTEILIGVGILQFIALVLQARFLGHHSTEMARIAGTAKMSAETARDTLRLTQCADVLIDGINISTGAQFRPDSVVTIFFKNCGATRADQVKFNMLMGVTDALQDQPFPIAQTALGAGETAPVQFTRVGRFITQESLPKILNGDLQFTFEGVVEYIDVFKQPHRTLCGGLYDPRGGQFLVTRKHAE